MTTTVEIIDALRSIPEPCSIAMRAPTNIVDMGLVESVEIFEGRVVIVLVLTDPSCVHFLGMRRYINDVLTELSGVGEVEVRMSTTQLWTSDRLRQVPA